MKHQEVILLFMLTSLTLFSCGWDPRFTVHDNCIETVSGMFFVKSGSR